MNDRIRTLTPDEIETYRRDGVVCIRGALSDDWVAVVRDAVDDAEQRYRQASAEGSPGEDLPEPTLEHSHLLAMGQLGEILEKQGMDVLRDRESSSADGQYILVNNAVLDYPAVQRLALESPLAEAAAALFGADKVNLIFDQVFVKQPGAVGRTAFHQDQPYFRVDGEQCASFWTPCEPVDQTNGAMGYVKGSHRWGLHAPNEFVSQTPTGEYGLPQLPDIEGCEEEYDIVYFDVNPGDVIVHDYRTVHGARGNVSASRGRRSVSIRYGGDDLVYLDRPSARGVFPKDPALADGDPLDGEVFPVVWRRP